MKLENCRKCGKQPSIFIRPGTVEIVCEHCYTPKEYDTAPKKQLSKVYGDFSNGRSDAAEKNAADSWNFEQLMTDEERAKRAAEIEITVAQVSSYMATRK